MEELASHGLAGQEIARVRLDQAISIKQGKEELFLSSRKELEATLGDGGSFTRFKGCAIIPSVRRKNSIPSVKMTIRGYQASFDSTSTRI